MLNVLIAKTKSLSEIVSGLLSRNDLEIGSLITLVDFEKLPFKNVYDIDFVIADMATLLQDDSKILSQIDEKGLLGKLIVIGRAEKHEALSNLISNGIRAYEPDGKKALDKILQLFKQRINEKNCENLISELINNGMVAKKIKQALDKGDSRLFQKSLSAVNKMLPVPLSLIKEYYALIMKTVFEFAEEKGIRRIEKKEMISELIAQPNFEKTREYASKKITGIIHLVEMNKKNQNKMVAEYIKDYVDENYMKQDTNVGNIAERFGVSGSYIGTLFREQEKTTITKYITQLRIEKAAELLAETKLQIQAISKKVGYSDQNYFARIFKKQTGLSPGEYRSNSSR